MLGLGLLGLGLWFANSSWLVGIDPDHTTRLLAHRGVHQIHAGPDRTADTCSANPIHPPDHNLIANTLPSIRAAFDAGAQVVEIDVHLTRDGVFAVFHDWTLDCQTDGTGVTHEQEFAYLRSLDIGYGYSADGVTFPLRGTGLGAMPSLTEVLRADLGGHYLINFKSRRTEDGAALAQLLIDLGPTARAQVWGVYGGAPPTRTATDATADLRGFDKGALRDCALRYAAVGWTGVVPSACANRIIAVPMDYGPFLWGWPHRFTARMKSVGTDVILWGPYDGTGFSSGIDDHETMLQVPKGFDGYVWTNRIDRIGPAFLAP